MVYKSIVAALLVQASSAVQLSAPQDDVVLQVNGVPVYVNSESMMLENSMAKVNLGIKINIGPDDVAFSQKSKPSTAPSDAVTLQVNGVPVLVNPETMLALTPNQMASANIG